MHNAESVLENKTQKHFGYFEIPTDHLISARRTCKIVYLAAPADPWVKSIESEKKKKNNENLNLTREMKILWNMNMVVILIVIGAVGTVKKDWYMDRRRWKEEDDLRPSKLQNY